MLPTPSPKPPLSFKLVGIGASAGGLEAFSELLRHLPVHSGVAYVLVQHLDPTHRSLLAELLSRTTEVPVREIAQNTKVEPNQIYVIPPNCDLAVEEGVLKLTPRTKSAGPARSIDRFFESLAADQGANAIAVVLSGAGSDGAKGLRAIKGAGGITFAQDASSKYDSMPRSAVATGCVDFVLPPDKIATEISRLVRQPEDTRSRAAANARQRKGKLQRPKATRPSGASVASSSGTPLLPWPPAPEDANLRKIFVLLRTRTGTDFSLYRINTIRRRLTRRLNVHKIKGLEAYVRFLRERPDEIDALYQDLLIHVTSFFRNPRVFDTLKKTIFPKLVKQQRDGEALRFWVAGCSTGQEAFSIAMAYAEFAEKSKTHIPVQIFASDVNATLLERARSGRYSKSDVADISPARLQRFFVHENGTYRLQKPIRDMVLFAEHNLLTDPPFTRVDMITCRNMLIYLEPALQQKIIPSFHYALKSNGYLVLGTSESVGQFNTLFDPVEKTQKIYLRKATTARLRFERAPIMPAMPPPPTSAMLRPTGAFNPNDAYREADRLTLANYAPVGVLVDEAGEILQFRGDAQRFLELPSGKANFNLFKMARPGLASPLKRALQRAQAENRIIQEKQIQIEGTRIIVNLQVVPLKNLRTRCFLVLFDQLKSGGKPVLAEKAARPSRKAQPGESRRYDELKRDNDETHAYLSNLQEAHDTSVEELQASNEEVQSANEELQSLNEELETSNEELESANEELTTLNEELATRNTELRESEQRLREQAELLELAPVLARTPKDRIFFWNRGAEQLYGFTKEEALGQTAHLFLNAQFPQPLEKIHAQLQKTGHWEGEVFHRRKDGNVICVASQWVLHLDAQRKPRAILEVNADVTKRREAERALRESEEFNRGILESSPDSIQVLDLEGRLTFMSPAGLDLMEISDFKTVANAYWPAFWEGSERQQAEKAYRAALNGRATRFHGFCRTVEGTPKWWDVALRAMLGPDGKPQKVLVSSRDITESKLAEIAATEEVRFTSLRADVASTLVSSHSPRAVAQKVANLLLNHLHAASTRLWTFNESTATLELEASAGNYSHLDVAHARIKLGEQRLGRLALERKPQLVNDVPADPELGDPEWARLEGMTSFAAFPLVSDDHLLGMLAVFGRVPFEPRTFKELTLYADTIAQYMHRKRSEEERASLYREAMTARNEAIAASRAKDDFLAALSHELRTPLNPVLLLASESANDASLSEDVRGTFATIRNNVSLEAKLIDDLLDITRIAHGKLSLEMKIVDVHAILRDALGIVASDIEEKHIVTSVQLRAERTLVVGDTVRLQQVFWNVLKNAVKFTPAGGQITLESSLTGDGERLIVRIIDSGVGLAAKDLEHIFGAFSQTEHRYGGLGLGLAISRRLLENHGGVIRATSDGVGSGSTFEIELPLARQSGNGGETFELVPRIVATAREPKSPPVPLVSGNQRRILLIEDHVATRSALKKLLTHRNFSVVTAGSIAEARTIMRADDAPEIVISDLGLPDGDGCDLWSELRDARPQLVGIALSGYGMQEDIARSKAAGFAGHLIKPINMASLDRALATLVPAARADAEGERDGNSD